MKKLLLLLSFFTLCVFFANAQQNETDTINYFLEKYSHYKKLKVDRQDLLAVASLYLQIDEKDTAWADISMKVRNNRVVDLSITGLNKISFPEPLRRLDALEGLAIKGCYFYQLPSLKPFPMLKFLGIWTSRLRDTLLVDESYRNLEVLGIHQFHAKGIKFVDKLKVKTLYLIDCDMHNLHKSFANLKETQEIHLGGNKLDDFDLSMLPKLQRINCYRNLIPIIHRKALKAKHKNIEINFDEY
jgi:Leucine-rich repeat (LRR) protein